MSSQANLQAAKAAAEEASTILPSHPTVNWFSHLPVPSSSPTPISVEDVHRMVITNQEVYQEAGVDYLVVDVRRNDIEEEPLNFMIPHAINLPAQTFYQTLPSLLPMLSRVPHVIFHCTSSSGRGPRCAGWYQDLLDSNNITTSKALILTGGIKKWNEVYGHNEKCLMRL